MGMTMAEKILARMRSSVRPSAGPSSLELPRRTYVPHVAFTGEQLSVAVRALFDIAARNVELSLSHGAVVTRRRCDPPTEAFVSVLDPSERLPANLVVLERLRALDFCWPFWGHA